LIQEFVFRYKNLYFDTRICISIQEFVFRYKNLYFDTDMMAFYCLRSDDLVLAKKSFKLTKEEIDSIINVEA
jgi:hypothetical protein